MNTEFTLGNRSLTLIRYPKKHQHKSLQAWDSADELLIEHIDTHLADALSTGPMFIFNDDFGALGCWYAHYHPVWISDSYIGLRSLHENLIHNQHSPIHADDSNADALVKPITSLTSIGSLTYTPASPPRIIMVKIPRTLALLEQQLIDIKRYATSATHIIAAGKVKSVTKSVLSLFEKIIGPTTTSLAKKKSRLIFSSLNEDIKPKASPYPTKWQCLAANNTALTLFNHANVFSRQSLDIGARLMIQHMHVSNNETVVDLGCGNGVLGLNALALAPDCNVIFVDESYMALESARLNVLANFPDKINQCQFIASNCLESLLDTPSKRVTRVLCNPPFHQQNAITDHIAWQMFHDANDILISGGHLIVVGNRHLEHHVKLKRLFGGVKVLASDKKFVILGSVKR